LQLFTERNAPPAALTEFSDPSSKRWDTIVGVLQRVVEKSGPADILLSHESIAAVVALLPPQIKPLHGLLDSLLFATRHATPGYDLEPILKPLVANLMTTSDKSMRSELLDFSVGLFREVMPPLSTQPDLYRKLRELAMSDLDEDTRTDVFCLQGSLIKKVGPDFLFNPPVCDVDSKKFALAFVHQIGDVLPGDLGSLTPKTDDKTKRRVAAQIDIIGEATTFLLEHNGDVTIAGEALTPAETVAVQSKISDTINLLATFLQLQYNTHGTQDGNRPLLVDGVDDVVCAAVGAVAAWLVKGGFNGSNENYLKLFTVFFALCCHPTAHELMFSVIRGLRGIVEFTQTGVEEYMKWKDVWMIIFGDVLDITSFNELMPEPVAAMSAEMCATASVMIHKRPSLIKEDAVRKFPKALYERIGWKELREPSRHAKAAASILAVEILLKIAEEKGSKENKGLHRKWRSRLIELVDLTRDENQKARLQSMILVMK
jgi:hypothetical protein